MKITKTQLKQIIKEELGKVMEDEAPEKQGISRAHFETSAYLIAKAFHGVMVRVDQVTPFVDKAQYRFEEGGNRPASEWRNHIRIVNGDNKAPASEGKIDLESTSIEAEKELRNLFRINYEINSDNRNLDNVASGISGEIKKHLHDMSQGKSLWQE